MCEDVRLQVGGLGKLFVAAVKRAHVRAISSVDAHVRAQVKVQRKSFAAALECALQTRGQLTKLNVLEHVASLPWAIGGAENTFESPVPCYYIYAYKNTNISNFLLFGVNYCINTRVRS